jgi:hypothetical protein
MDDQRHLLHEGTKLVHRLWFFGVDMYYHFTVVVTTALSPAPASWIPINAALGHAYKNHSVDHDTT